MADEDSVLYVGAGKDAWAPTPFKKPMSEEMLDAWDDAVMIEGMHCLNRQTRLVVMQFAQWLKKFGGSKVITEVAREMEKSTCKRYARVLYNWGKNQYKGKEPTTKLACCVLFFSRFLGNLKIFPFVREMCTCLQAGNTWR
jgi:hypothetical protein